MIHLTGHNYNAHELIQSIFSPLIGVISDQLANNICQRNNLSFVEMLQPFAKLPKDAHFRDVSGTSVSIRGLRLNICDVYWYPPQTTLARKMLNEAVIRSYNDKVKSMSIGAVDVEIPSSNIWFEHWRETFLTVQFPADHEFTRHFLSCLIVVSSSDPNIIETAAKLTRQVQQMQNITPQKLPKWFYPNNVLNSYVVLHEGSNGDLLKAQQSYELLKSTYTDSKCFLIQINTLDGSVTTENPDYWAPYIRNKFKSYSEDQIDQNNTPKTPQDTASITVLPTMQMPIINKSDIGIDIDRSMLHPLSPVQDQVTEAIDSKFSTSNESIASQNINVNVWTYEPDPNSVHGCCLNAMDVENIRHFIQDYAVRALIPYIENLVTSLNDAITNKKGVSKSLLSATKRWFIASKPSAGASNQNAVIYTNESAELQTRKLGDLYFMFGHYNLAFQAYHQAKRDFNADSAWQYYAGALEMAAVSAFMLGTANRKTYDYMEDAITCYLTVCKLQQFATRATLLSMECLKAGKLYSEAAKQLVRMTSEESDLRSALLLEQAAYCFLLSQPSMYRKYAFHTVLSGNRYSRAGHRKHAYRCYKQAYKVFQNLGWSLAEDHIQYTMAKQAYTLKKLEEASASFAYLLRSGSQQSSQQQACFLKDYIQTKNELFKSNSKLHLLEHALPQVVQSSIRLLLTDSLPISNPSYVSAKGIDINCDLSDEHIWQKMEEMTVASATFNKPFVFKPSQRLFTRNNFTNELPLGIQNEPVELAVTLLNTISCSIALTGINLLWKLTLDNGETLSNLSLYEDSDETANQTAICAAIKIYCEPSIILEQRSKEILKFKLTSKVTGHLNIIGIVTQIAAAAEPTNFLQGFLSFEREKAKSTDKQTTESSYNNNLELRIIPSLPSLNVGFSTIPKDLISGEILPVTIYLRNSGIMPIKDVYLVCENPRCITLLNNSADIPLSLLNTFKAMSNEKLTKDKEIRRQHVFRLLHNETSSALKRQEDTTITMWIQAPYQKGEFNLRLLFYYGIPDDIADGNVKYRIVRHSWTFNIHECLHTEISCNIVNTITDELGLNVTVKNLNELHHPVLADLYINSLGIYSPQYKTNSSNVYHTNQMELTTGSLGDYCLKCSKSASFQCRLEIVDDNLNSIKNSPPEEMLNDRLTLIPIMQTVKNKDNNIPDLNKIYSFLMKHETIFFSTNISNEEFNTIAATKDSHITVIINWTAMIIQNSESRVAYGQHFLKVRKVYEVISCPVGTISQSHLFQSSTAQNNIFNYVQSAECTFKEKNNPFTNADEIWDRNETYVNKRCMLVDESFIFSVKT